MSEMSGLISGRAWVFGDNVNTDLMAPARFLRGSVGDYAPHCMESLMPDFASSVRPGDIVIGGRNFGCGSSREQAPEALKHLGIAAIVARSFARTFYRNAMNLGLPVVVCDAAGDVATGVRLTLSLESGVLRDPETGKTWQCQPIPAHLMAMLADGGLLGHLARRLKMQRAGATR